MSQVYNGIRHSVQLVEKLIDLMTGELIVARSDLLGSDKQGPVIVMGKSNLGCRYVKVLFVQTGALQEVSMHALDLFYDIDRYADQVKHPRMST